MLKVNGLMVQEVLCNTFLYFVISFYGTFIKYSFTKFNVAYVPLSKLNAFTGSFKKTNSDTWFYANL